MLVSDEQNIVGMDSILLVFEENYLTLSHIFLLRFKKNLFYFSLIWLLPSILSHTI